MHAPAMRMLQRRIAFVLMRVYVCMLLRVVMRVVMRVLMRRVSERNTQPACEHAEADK